MPSTGKNQTRRSIVENGPDPVGSALWDQLADRTALELSSQGAPLSVRVGMKGDPTVTYEGDLGPIQTSPTSYGAQRVFGAENAGQALPATSSPVAGNTTLKSLVQEYGL